MARSPSSIQLMRGVRVGAAMIYTLPYDTLAYGWRFVNEAPVFRAHFPALAHPWAPVPDSFLSRRMRAPYVGRHVARHCGCGRLSPQGQSRPDEAELRHPAA